MLRRCASCAPLAAVQTRRLATEHQNLTPFNHSNHKNENNKKNSEETCGAAQPPAVSSSSSSTAGPLLPMDFNPHIEWFEYPKEVFDPKYPYTREESLRMTDEVWESSLDEMASRYGMRLNLSTKPTFWLAWGLTGFYAWYTLWGCYRAMGTEPGWAHFKHTVLLQPNAPTLEDDDIFLDQWSRPEMREKFSRYDRFWNWKPLVKREGAQTSWAIPMQHQDESEWKHLTSTN